MSQGEMRLFFLWFIYWSLFSAFHASADFRYLPEVPDYSVVREFDEAIYQHFRTRQLAIEAISSYASDNFMSFKVTDSGRQYFLRIFRNDCPECPDLRFDQEWLLRQDIESSERLASINVYRLLPETAATFVFQRKRFYLSSFSPISGNTIEELYRLTWLTSPNITVVEQRKTLGKAIYRLGQALAVFALDPTLPVKSSPDLLQRKVRTRLPGRTARNQLFDVATGSLFFTELVVSQRDPLTHQNVDQLLSQWFASYLFMISRLNDEPGFECGRSMECLTQPFERFVEGFQSVLPAYDSLLLKDILSGFLLEQLDRYCGVDQIFCRAKKLIGVSRYFQLR